MFLWIQKDAMEDSIEIVIEKLLHIAKDAVSKVPLFSSVVYYRLRPNVTPSLEPNSIQILCSGFYWSREMLIYYFIRIWSFPMSECMFT